MTLLTKMRIILVWHCSFQLGASLALSYWSSKNTWLLLDDTFETHQKLAQSISDPTARPKGGECQATLMKELEITSSGM